MTNRYRLFRRSNSVYYLHDSRSGKQFSLKTINLAEAEELLHARNSAERQPMLNLEIGRAYLVGADPRMAERTWSDVMKEYATHGRPSTQERSLRVARSKSLAGLAKRKLIETTSEDLLDLLHKSGAAVNNYLRRYHNLAFKLGWLPKPILHPALWPKVIPKRKRAVTVAEYEGIIRAEKNVERRAYYTLLWETGAAQTDGAQICGEDIDWEKGHLIYKRQKLSPERPPCALAPQ